MKKVLLYAICILLFSCEDKFTSEESQQDARALLGTWLLYEKGYSPGAGYIVEAVGAELEQTITFKNNHRMEVTIPWLEDFEYYAVMMDENNQDVVLAFYESNPGPSPKLSSSDHKYTLVTDESGIKLYFRFCIEGCHLALKRD